MEAAVVVRGVMKSYGSTPVLAGVSLTVARGESAGIVGPNGAGKSTLLRIIAGIEEPDAGEVIVRGSVGYVPQETILLPWRTLRGNILLAARIRGVPRDRAARILEEYSRLLGLRDYLDYYPRQVSGGTARKAQILMALVLEPDILLLDEPFTGLDRDTIEALQGAIRELKKRRFTIIVVSHMIDELMGICDRLYVLTHRPARVRRVIDLGAGR